MLLGKRITKVRKGLLLSQVEVADRLDIEQATYSGYEKEAGNLTFKTICKIANALGCSVLFLIDIDSDIYNELEWKRQKCKEWSEP
jgi:transcriptional regulator with XRE-family HTH domain